MWARIERLAKLRQKGILTEEEFTTKKAGLLARLWIKAIRASAWCWCAARGMRRAPDHASGPSLAGYSGQDRAPDAMSC